MIECYEIQDAIYKIKGILNDKCKVLKPSELRDIIDIIEAVRRCITEEADPKAVLYTPQNRTEIEKEIARDNIGAVTTDDVIQYIKDNNVYLANEFGFELTENKQNNLTPDGSGTKYPTVDAVNTKFQEIEDDILNISGDKTYVHEQVTPSKVWEYEHNLGKKPSVQVTDSAGTVIMGQVTVNDGTKVRIEFNIAFWGYATNN